MASTLKRPKIGELAPAIELLDGNGENWRLEDHRGETVVLIFHRHIF